MKFKTYNEAEEYYFSNIAKTNNMHGEESANLENWLGEQNIEERTKDEDEFELTSILARRGKDWCLEILNK
jgi:hypothetical protein